MKVLLDTHIFIWWNGDLSALSPAARSLCEDKENILVLSLASVWEMQIKYQLGKLTFHQPLSEIIQSQQRGKVQNEEVHHANTRTHHFFA